MTIIRFVLDLLRKKELLSEKSLQHFPILVSCQDIFTYKHFQVSEHVLLLKSFRNKERAY